ncbi:hypothetical protein Taitung50_09790 [Helicobacter pylori]
MMVVWVVINMTPYNIRKTCNDRIFNEGYQKGYYEGYQIGYNQKTTL